MREFELDKCVRYLTCGEVGELRGCARSRGRQCRENGLEAGKCAVHELSYYLHTRRCRRSRLPDYVRIMFTSSTFRKQYESLVQIKNHWQILSQRWERMGAGSLQYRGLEIHPLGYYLNVCTTHLVSPHYINSELT